MTYLAKLRLFPNFNKRVFICLLLTVGLAIFAHGAFAAEDPFNDTTNAAAHFFDPSPNDQSLIYLGEIFGNVAPVLAGTGSSLMSDLFAVFNSAVLVLGIFFLGYTTFVGILNTAGEGEMLGRKWSSIWVIVRMVAGLALIMPTTTGYCVIQVFVMWLIVQGIGAADNLTNTIVDYMKSDQPVYSQGATAATAGGGEKSSNGYDQTITQIYANLTCMQANPNSDSTDAIVPPEPTCGTDANGNTITGANACANANTSITYTFTAPNGTNCGKLGFASANGGQAYTGQTPDYYIMNAVDMIMPSLNSAAYYLVNYNPYEHDDDPENDQTDFIPSNDYEGEPVDYKQEVLQATYDFVGSNFLNQLQQTYYSYVSQANSAIASLSADDGNDAYYDDIYDYGWVSLGGIYWYMAKAGSLEGGDPDSTAGTYAKLCPASDKTTCDAATDSGTGGIYIQWAKDFFNLGLIPMQANNTTDGSAYSEDLYSYSDLDEDLGNLAEYMPHKVSNEMMHSAAQELSKTDQNPLVSAQKIGHHTINAVEDALGIIIPFVIGMSVISGLMSSTSPWFLLLQSVVSFAVPITFAWMMFYYALGGMLSVFVPMLPAVIFFLAVCNWMVTVLESMIAAPIVAIGALHGEGHEVWGKAEPAILLLANMFLRPSLIVIGMAAGILLSFVFLQFVNFAFFTAMTLSMDLQEHTLYLGAGSITFTEEPKPIETMLYMMTYVGVLLAVINQAFTAISLLPDQVMRWIAGGEGAKFAGSGGADQMGKVEQQQSKGQEQAGAQVRATESGTGAAAQKAGEAGQKSGDLAKKAIGPGAGNIS